MTDSPTKIRDLDQNSEQELDVVTEMCMKAVLETAPEFEGSVEKAKAVLPNFDFAQMKAMIRADFDKPTHRFLVAVDATGTIRGHSMFSVKVDKLGRRYGSFFTRYVEPSYRRRGIATDLLKAAMRWFDDQGVEYMQAETHATNLALVGVFSALGFEIAERHTSPWPYLVLRKSLDSGIESV